ncbi:maestro heat-like repeat family member 5 [Muntiacus reevesi]|uniref:maestro heat-like repeat family member 5 n=1 Tax=Muntiacus reevesi TaxID=9886 RepID=UPI003306CB0D
MDAQHSEKPHSHASTNRTSSARSQNSRSAQRQAGAPVGQGSKGTSSHISELTKSQAYMKVPHKSAHGNRQRPLTAILLCKSQTSQAALMPKEHRTFIKESYNKAICFKLLQDLSSSDSVQLRYNIKKIKDIAQRAPNLALETISDYFVNNQQISTRHKFRLFHVLEAAIGASESLEETWEKSFMQLALENMTKSTELEEAYQDAAGNVLVAICRHSWQAVAQHLETEVLSGVFPHRSLLYVMGIMTSDENLFKEGEKAGWEEQLAKMAIESVPFLNREAWSKELLGTLTRPDHTQQGQPPEKAFLFIYYGLMLQASENGTTVRTHLKTLLETSHQWSKQREGMALTVGLAAARHLDHVWAVLRQFGRSTAIKWSLNSFSCKNSEDLRWKWASSTILLAYGQMADKAKAHILPWVDNILSRMVFFFHYSHWDETLKQSFVTAILMLVGAISRNEGAQSYEFSQVSELLKCLMLLMKKEPQDRLCTTTRRQTLNIISSLCKLRPPLDLEKRSRLLSISLRSVISLPPLEVLEKHTCLFMEPPNIQPQAAPPPPGAPPAAKGTQPTERLPGARPTPRLRQLSFPAATRPESHLHKLSPGWSLQIGSLGGGESEGPLDPGRHHCSGSPEGGRLPRLQPCGSAGCPSDQTLYKETAGALEQMLQNFITQNPTAKELHFLLSHLYVWLASEKAHERQRAVHSCMALLQFLSHNLYLDPKEDFKRIGQLVGMLWILCQDPDKTTQYSSLKGMAYLYKLLMHQRGEPLREQAPAPQEPPQANKEEAELWSGGDQEAAPPSPQEVALSKDHVLQPGSPQAKDIMKHLTMAELTDLIWTAVDGLGSTSPFRVQAAANMLLTAIQEHGAKLETVTTLGQAIHLQLCSVRIPKATENALQAVTLLARNHTSELVTAFLDFSITLDSHSFRLWRALGAEHFLSHRVLAVLLGCLLKRPLPSRASGGPQPRKKAYLHSLAAMNTLHELQFAPEFQQAVQEAFPELLLALLTQMHYLLELNLTQEPQPGAEAQETALLGPQRCSTSLEALKSLLSTTMHWQDFAHMELQGAWDLFATIHTFPQGVGLLARAMVQNHCRQIKGLTLHLLPNLRSREERDRKAAISIFTEFLYSPTLLEVLPKEVALSVLVRSLRDPSPEIRVLSLQGLGNILFHPEKRSLLRGQLPPFLKGFFQSSEPVVVCIMGTVSEALHRLGAHITETLGLRIAINTHAFFDDERDRVRAAAMALFGELVASVTGQKFGSLRTQVHKSMVPLLLHLKDHCPTVVMQAKFAFYRCSVLLQWRLPHTIFCTLAWEESLSARHFLWRCLINHSQDEFGTYWAQALNYLHRRHHHLKIWAALFISYIICYYPLAMSQTASDMDIKLLVCTFEDLKKNPEPSIRYFASRQASFLQKVVARPQ